jgi:hypothetical protein
MQVQARRGQQSSGQPTLLQGGSDFRHWHGRQVGPGKDARRHNTRSARRSGCRTIWCSVQEIE